MPTEKLAKCSTLMLSMSISVRLLTSSVKALAQLSIADLIKGLTSVIVLLKSLVVITNGITTTKLAAVGFGLMEVAVAIRILASSAKVFADMDITGLLKAGTAIASLLTALTLFNKFNAGTKGIVSVGFSMTLISTAFLEFAAFAKIVASISWEGLSKAALSLVGILGSFTALGATLSTLQKTCPTLQSQLLKFSGILVIFGVACQEFAIYAKIIGSMSWSGLAKAVTTLVGILGTFTLLGVALTTLNSKFPEMSKELLKFGATMAVFGVALSLMAPAILMLSTMKLSEAAIAVGSIVTLMAAIELACFAMQAVPWSGIAKASVGMLAFGAVLAVIAGIVSKLVAISDCDGATKVMKAMGELAVEMAIALDALIVAGTFASAALIGIGVMSAAIAALTTLVWAIGALSDGGTVRKFERGVEIMGLVGKAIGEFFGNIVGGFIDGATSTLEDVADRLIYFIDAIKDIMNTVSSIDTSVLKSCKDIVSVIDNFGNIKYATIPSVEETNSMKGQLEAIAGLFIAYSDKFQNGVKDLSNLKVIFADTASASESLSDMIKTLGTVTWDLSMMPDEGGIEKLKNKLVSLVGFMTAFYQELTSSTSFKADLAVTIFGYAKSAIKSMMDCVGSVGNIGWNTIGLPEDPSYIKSKLVGMADMMTGFYEALTAHAEFKLAVAATMFKNAGEAITAIIDVIPLTSNLGPTSSYLPDKSISEQILKDLKGVADLVIGYYRYFADAGFVDFSKAKKIFINSADAATSLNTVISGLTYAYANISALPSGKELNTKRESALSGVQLMIDLYKKFENSGISDFSSASSIFASATDASYNLSDLILGVSDFSSEASGMADSKFISSWWSSLKTFIDKLISTYTGIIAQGVTDGSAMSSMFSSLKTATASVFDLVSEIRNGDTTDLKSANTFVDSLKEFLNNLASIATEIDSSAIDTVASLMKKVKSSIENGKVEIENVSLNLGSSIVESMTEGIGKANEIGKILVTNFRSGMTTQTTTAMSSARVLIQQIVKVIKSEIGDAKKGGAAYDAGNYFVQGLAKGISENKNDAVNAAIKLANDTLEKTRKVYDEHSPSKETYEIGEYFDKGLGNGIDEYRSYVIQTVEKMSQKTLDALHNSFKSGELKVSDVIGSNYSSAITTYGALIVKSINEMSADTLATLEENIASGSTSISEFLNSTYQDIYDDVSSIVENSFKPFEAFDFNLETSISDMFSNLQSQIKGMDEWSSMLADLGARGISESLYAELEAMGTSGYNYVKNFSMMTNDQLAQYNELWAQSMTLKESSKANIMTGWNAAAQWVNAGFAQGLQPALAAEITTAYAQKGLQAFKNAYGIASPSKRMEENGRWTSLGFKMGMQTSWNSLVIPTIKTSANNGIITFKSYFNKANGESIGEQFTNGLASGIRSGNSGVVNAAISIATNALKAARQALSIHSPSKKMMEVGMFFDLGFAKGIDNYANDIDKSAQKASYSALDVVKEALNQVNDEMNMDGNYDPTIRPILDLSEVQKGTKELADMMNGQNISASMINSTASRISRTASEVSKASNINESTQTVNNYTFNQTNNSPKALDRYQIYRQTRNQIAMMKGVMQ